MGLESGVCRFLEIFSRLKGEEPGILFSTVISPGELSRFLSKRFHVVDFWSNFGVLFLPLTSANGTKCQNLLFNNFESLFCFSMRFVSLAAYELGLATKASKHSS